MNNSFTFLEKDLTVFDNIKLKIMDLMKECYQLTDEDFDTSIFMHCENIKSKVEEKAI